MKRRTWSAIAMAAIAPAMAATACGQATPASTSAIPCARTVCVSEPQQIGREPRASEADPDPTRNAILTEVRTERTDQMLDHIYLGAMGLALNQRPATWADEIADRRNHEQCLTAEWETLWAGTAPEATETTIAGTREERAIALNECSEAGQGNWNASPGGARAAWSRHILEAARRATSPAHAVRPYIRNEEQDPGWQTIDEAYRKCEGPVAALADLVAQTRGGHETSAAMLDAITETVKCNEAAGNLAYPQGSTGPEPGSKDGSD